MRSQLKSKTNDLKTTLCFGNQNKIRKTKIKKKEKFQEIKISEIKNKKLINEKLRNWTSTDLID